jgi:hypothetical protein
MVLVTDDFQPLARHTLDGADAEAIRARLNLSINPPHPPTHPEAGEPAVHARAAGEGFFATSAPPSVFPSRHPKHQFVIKIRRNNAGVLAAAEPDRNGQGHFLGGHLVMRTAFAQSIPYRRTGVTLFSARGNS